MKQQPLKKPKLHQEIAARLEQMIYAGELAEGDQLPSERDLMAIFSVGRPAVREALLTLEKTGVVAVRSGMRAFVTRPTAAGMISQLSQAARHLMVRPDGIRNFQEARRLFETGLAGLAAQMATSSDFDKLTAALEANRLSIGDRAAFERSDVAFHYAIAEVPRNPLFLALHDAIVEWLIDQRHLSLRRDGNERRAYNHHRKIHDAILARDAPAASAAMSVHLLEVEKLYWATVEGAPRTVRPADDDRE
jgi:DNA-binding FadR family transcriptional regulator